MSAYSSPEWNTTSYLIIEWISKEARISADIRTWKQSVICSQRVKDVNESGGVARTGDRSTYKYVDSQYCYFRLPKEESLSLHRTCCVKRHRTAHGDYFWGMRLLTMPWNGTVPNATMIDSSPACSIVFGDLVAELPSFEILIRSSYTLVHSRWP
jgi:hypothetical protein